MWQDGDTVRMTLEFAQTLYFREIDRRFQLDAAPTVRVAALGLLGAIFSFYIGRYQPSGRFLPWLFLICVAGALVSGALAVIWIVRSYAGFIWQYLPSAARLIAHYHDLEIAANRAPAGTLDAKQVFETGLIEHLAAAAAHNARNNNIRSELLYYASSFIASAVAFTFLAGVPVLFESLARWPLF